VVFAPEKIVVAHNVYCESYIGGWGVQVWDPLDTGAVQDYADGKMSADMFVTIRPMKDQNLTKWRSLCGFMPKSMGVSGDVNQLVWYPGSHAVSTFWGFCTESGANGDYAGQGSIGSRYVVGVNQMERKMNMVCMQGVQLKWEPSTKGFTTVVLDAGHWGDKIGVGARSVVDGHKLCFDEPFYSTSKVVQLV
jgi:hypothetical protein